MRVYIPFKGIEPLDFKIILDNVLDYLLLSKSTAILITISADRQKLILEQVAESFKEITTSKAP